MAAAEDRRQYLTAELTGRTAEELAPPPVHRIDVEVSLGTDWHRDPMALDPYS